MVYHPNDQGRWCRTCVCAEFSGHRTGCWKPDVMTMSEGAATLLKYQYIADITNTQDAEADGASAEERVALDPDYDPHVTVCATCFRGRGVHDQQQVDCYCGGKTTENLICLEALEQLEEWLKENGHDSVAAEFWTLVEGRAPPPEVEEEGEDDEEDDDSCECDCDRKPKGS